MLKPTKELFEKYKYNDDIEYLIGDDFNYESPIFCPNTKLNRQVEEIAKRSLRIFYTSIDYNKADLSHLTGSVQERYINIDKDWLNQFTFVRIDINDKYSKKEALRLKDRSYDGIRYYCKTDILLIPEVLYKYIKKNPTRCKVSIYNYKFCPEEYKTIFNCQEVTPPELKFKHIPNKLKYARLEKNTYVREKEYSVLYTNLPREYYRKICVDNETLAYNTSKKCFIGHSDCNQTKLNHLCYDVATNGFKKIIQLKLLSDGRLTPYCSNKRLLIGEYLNLPSIPVAIISDIFSYPEYLLYYNSGSVKELAQKYLSPYFLF